MFAVARMAVAQPGVVASDDATNYCVSANWTNGSNQGFGFMPWTLTSSGPNSHGWYIGNGQSIGDSINAGGTNYTNCSFGLYANGSTGTNRTVAFRGFAGPLTTNLTFKIRWESKGVGATTVNGVQVHGLAGLSLRNGNSANSTLDYDTGSRFDLYFLDGSAAPAGQPTSFLVADGTGVVYLGVGFSAGGRSLGTNALQCEFTLEPNDTYRLVLRSVVGNQILAVLDQRPLRTDTSTASSSIDSVALYCLETTGDQNYNQMLIVSNALVAPVIVNVQPTNGAFFVNPASNPVSFEVDSLVPRLVGSNITLLLNGVTQALAFNTNGPAQRLLATNTTQLASNLTYSAAIIAVDDNGNSATNAFGFNTVQTNSLWLDVRNFGAAANGTTNDTAAIQAAITACAPGGFVWLHSGTFRSGTIYLRNNMTLYIDPTATLLGSGSSNDYPMLNPPANNSQQNNCDKALVYAQSCSNITVTGGGTINGNGRTNFTSGVEATRPIALWTVLCNQVNIQNLAIVDAAMWTLVNMQSDYLTISNVTINDDGLNGNRDGCDVVDCWHVTIANCTIDSGDDSICLKSGNSRGVNDLLVKNCTITKSQSNGLKFGTASTGPFTNITFQDCTVLNTSHSAMAVESVDGGAISRVTFQRINFASCQNGLFIVLGSRSGAAVGSINGITFRDISGSSLTDTRGCPLSGNFTNGVTYKLKNLLFDNVNITFEGGLGSVPSAPPEYAGQYPENTMWGNLPAYGYYLRHADGVTFTNCYTSAAAADARPWMATNDVSNLKVFGPTLRSAQSGSNLILQWDNPFILQSATNAAGAYLDLAGSASPYTNPFSGGTRRFFRLRQ